MPSYVRTFAWYIGDRVTAPTANAKLASHRVGLGKKAYIHGFLASSTDVIGNTFLLHWRSGGKDYVLALPFSGGMVLNQDSEISWNELGAADPDSEIYIENENSATGGTKYQAALFIAEAPL